MVKIYNNDRNQEYKLCNVHYAQFGQHDFVKSAET